MVDTYRRKNSGTAGLVAGAALQIPEFSAAAAIGVVVYFIFAIIAHIRARFMGSEFWINCLGMFVFAILVAGFQISQVTF